MVAIWSVMANLRLGFWKRPQAYRTSTTRTPVTSAREPLLPLTEMIRSNNRNMLWFALLVPPRIPRWLMLVGEKTQ